MRIQHNIMAMNSYRNLSGNNGALSKNLEKLSSGYRINRAGDDAAGLAISEKMRAQISGLDQAQKNAQSGINMVKTAEGALTEVHDMLNRMTTLATQSANGTYSDTDRAKLQAEVDALTSEIDRIADNSNFNGTKLLDGSLASSGTAAAAKVAKFGNATTTESTEAKGKYTLGAAFTATMAKTETVGSRVEYTITYRDNANGSDKTMSFGFTLANDDDGKKVLISDSGKEYDIAAFSTNGVVAGDLDKALAKELANSSLADKFTMTTTSGSAFVFEAKEEGSDGAVLMGVTERKIPNDGTVTETASTITMTTQAKDAYKELAKSGITAYDGKNADKAIFTINGHKFVLAATGTDVTTLDKSVTVLTGADFSADHAKVISQKTGLNVTHTSTGNKLTFKPGAGVGSSGGMKLQIGADAVETINVAVDSMKAKDLGIANLSISTVSDANTAIDTIKAAIEKVSVTRGDLGAIQNRLEHTINNLGVMEENIQDAESNIRDTDIADEMMAYTKNNILIQSAQAMLAQANQVPQGVLQLMQ